MEEPASTVVLEPGGDDYSDHNLTVPLVTLAVIFVGMLWLLGSVPETVKELRRHVGSWSTVNALTRRVNCRPWGLQRTFTIAQDLATTAHKSRHHADLGAKLEWEIGCSLWNGAVALSRLFTEDRLALQSTTFADGRSVIEIGCGQALASMIVSELFPGLSRVVATDGSTDVLRSAGVNLHANLGEGHRIETAPLCWGNQEHIANVLAMNGGACYDVVLGADVTYMMDTYPLLQTILDLSHPGTEVWLAHEPRRRSLAGFLEHLRKEFNTRDINIKLTPEDTGGNGFIDVLGWHCVGKLEGGQ